MGSRIQPKPKFLLIRSIARKTPFYCKFAGFFTDNYYLSPGGSLSSVFSGAQENIPG
jgi:hypothetical protein